MFVSFGRMESWPSLSDTADVETTGRGVVGNSALCTAHTPGLSGLHPGFHAGVPFNFWVLRGGTPAPHLCPRCRGHAERTCVLPRHPQMRPDHSSWGSHLPRLVQARERAGMGKKHCGECRKFKRTPLLLAQGPPVWDESNSTSFNPATLSLDNNPEMHTDAEEVASSKL